MDKHLKTKPLYPVLKRGRGTITVDNESYTERFEHNSRVSSDSQDRLGECFFDWWSEIWCKKSTGTAQQYSGEYGMEELQEELRAKFPYHLVVDRVNKPLDPLKECMTSEWTSLTWDHKLYAYFETEEDKVKFILFST